MAAISASKMLLPAQREVHATVEGQRTLALADGNAIRIVPIHVELTTHELGLGYG